MPGTTGIGEGPDNKGGKGMKYADAQPQGVDEDKTEGKGKEVTNKGSESFSTAKPSAEENSEIQQEEEVEDEEETEVASDTKCSGFDPTIARISGGKNIALLLQLKKQETNPVIPRQEQEESKVAANTMGSDSGDSSENDTDESNLPEVLLFVMDLPHSNRFVVPSEKAADFFPSLSAGADASEVLQITDDQNEEWNMSFIYHKEENVFMFTKGWTEFAVWNNLKAMDVIRFYRTVPRLAPHHYLIRHERGHKKIPTNPEFMRKNFLFRVELENADIGYNRLFIPGKEVEIHFPAIKHVQRAKRKVEIVKFTDAGSKNWYMEIVRYDGGSYMIMDGWDEFVKEHNLEAKDLIEFYKPVNPSHEKHFLIEIARKVVAGTNPNRAGPSHGGSSKGLVKSLVNIGYG